MATFDQRGQQVNMQMNDPEVLKVLNPELRAEALARLREHGLSPNGRKVFADVRGRLQETRAALEPYIWDKDGTAANVVNKLKLLVEFMDECLAIEKVDNGE